MSFDKNISKSSRMTVNAFILAKIWQETISYIDIMRCERQSICILKETPKRRQFIKIQKED